MLLQHMSVPHRQGNKHRDEVKCTYTQDEPALKHKFQYISASGGIKPGTIYVQCTCIMSNYLCHAVMHVADELQSNLQQSRSFYLVMAKSSQQIPYLQFLKLFFDSNLFSKYTTSNRFPKITEALNKILLIGMKIACQDLQSD